ncbi:MAG: YiiX/YebB-like N1pC/P60 family cysteine hydrolase [Bacteroidota bacterium]
MRKLLLISILLGIAIGPEILSRADINSTYITKSVPKIPELKSGDLVFRSGKGFVSGIMRNTSLRDRTYSHVGLVIIKDGKPTVYHMMEKMENGKSISGLWCESLEDFCSERENNRVTVYRYANLNRNGLLLENEIRSLSAKEPTFDDHFDLSSDKELYCTEFVWKHFLNPCGIHIQISHTASGDFVGLDDLYLNPFAKKIFDIKFES